MPSPTTTAESPSNPTPITAPGLRIKTTGPSNPATSPEIPTPGPSLPPVEDPIDSTGTPSPDTAAEQHPIKVGKKTLADIARAAVASASAVVHGRFATTMPEQQLGVWLADDNDQAQIGDPLASIVQRHGLPAGAGSPDTADLIAAGIGLIAYLIKNLKMALAIRAQLRRDRADAEAAAEPAPEPVA